MSSGFDLTTYADPGVYTQEVVVPNGANVPGLPFAVTIIGTGSRNKRVTSEAVNRGLLTGEAVTFSGSPLRATLANRAVRSRNTTTLHKTVQGVTTTVGDNFLSFPAATISGLAGPYALSSTVNSISLQLDGLPAVTITLIQNNADTTPAVVAVGGTELQVSFDFPSHAISNATRANVAQCINAALGSTAAGLLGYGSLYGNSTGTTGVASGSGSLLTITSPNTTAASDVRVFPGFFHSAAVVIFGGSGTVNASTKLQLDSLAFDINATWAVDYVLAPDADTFIDPLANTQVQDIAQVGSFQGVGNFQENISWQQAGGSGSAASITTGAAPGFMRLTGLTGLTTGSVGGLLTISGAANFQNNGPFVIAAYISSTSCDVVNVNAVAPDGNNGSIVWSERRAAVDWGISTHASFTSTVAGSYSSIAATTADNFLLSVDGKRLVQIWVDDTNAPFTPLGFSAGTTAALVANNINAYLANDAAYGQRYNAVASAGGTGSAYLVLTSPTTGQSSSILVKGTTAAQQSVLNILWGFSSSQATAGQLIGMGAGQVPAQGANYFVSYDFTRPSSEYNVPFRFFTYQDATAQVGKPSAQVANYNPLAQAAQIAFANGAPVLYAIQIDDTSNPGFPSRAEVDAALDAAKTLVNLTEVVIIDQTSTAVAVDLLVHVEQECSPVEKHFRRGWFGVAPGTPVGDFDTAGSIVYEATQTLQVSPSSPGRGRYFLVAPPQKAGVSITFTLDDLSSIRRTVDSSYLAVACAALKTALPLASDTLMRRTVTGFNVDDITQPWVKQERAIMASNGVLVVTFDAGRLIMLDPVTTEGGGGNLIAFKQDSSSYQKDNVTTKVNTTLDANLVGIVPFDLTSFVTDIRLLIANVISSEIAAGNIGPYRDRDTNLIRPIDLLRDIIVVQSSTDPTKFFFKYWYNLLYPAARLLGEYSVDNPFFARAVAP